MKQGTPFTVRLRSAERAALLTHFTSLGGEDRRLRFGSSISDDALGEYVDRIDFEHDGVFAVQDDELAILAAIHVALLDTGAAELGLSVLEGRRGRGLGSALFERAVVHLRNRGIAQVYVHCLTENQAMMHIARKHGMRIIAAGPETDARLVLEPATAQSMLLEWMQDYGGDALRSLRRNSRFTQAFLKTPAAKVP